MATTTAEMGEIDELHSKEEVSTGESVLNGDMNETETEDSQCSLKKQQQQQEDPPSQDEEEEAMEVDDVGDSMETSNVDEENEEEDRDTVDGDKHSDEEEEREEIVENDENSEVNTEEDDDKKSVSSSKAEEDEEEDDEEGAVAGKITTNGDDKADVESDEVHEIDDEDDDVVEATPPPQNGLEKSDEPIELNSEEDEEEEEDDGDDGDVMIIEPKENGNDKNRPVSDELEVIELDTTPVKNKSVEITAITPRRSSRNANRQRSYVEPEEKAPSPESSEESDIEEVLPQDPLAVGNETRKAKRFKGSNSSTIVVKDTKRLVEIAAKSNSSNNGNKKEPTLVIIDTNSILSGRGPVPVSSKSASSSSANQSYSPLLPMGLPAQGMYPPNMRATITPIPMTSVPKGNASISVTPSSSKHQNMASGSSAAPPPPPPVLPTLTDDMFVVEAPSFIVPYVYEKPPMAELKDFVREIREQIEKEYENNDDDKDDEKDNKSDDDVIVESKKFVPYFESPLGKFFIDIGFNQVQEYVQADLLRQQKKKRDREGGQNPTTNQTIHSLLKNLEYSKENNGPFKRTMRKCEFCNFKTESTLVMAHHLETPHTKNYVYKCNFCAYEVRSPHDILFHTEAEHAIRGRLERAPSFHQCPNCPFEDNQKGKLSRHLVACMRKFKPERNMDPPLDWEPPAKIPRVPKARQGINMSAYQAMKSSQLQFLSKMQLFNTNSQHPLHRGRGRPTLTQPAKGQSLMRPTGMVYKQAMSGGSVLVPTNYQLSGNQVYQQQNQSKSKTVHQPSISITPLPRATSSPLSSVTTKPGDTSSKNSFVICEICDGYIKDLEQLRNHMQWIHKVKIHPKMIYNRPPLNCQKCQFRFFTDQGLERHLLGSHGLVTSSMQDAANKSKDSGRCPVCGRVYQWKLLNHVARDHNMTLKPAHLSYKCTVCTATFGMYKQFENHVYSAHSVVAKRVMDKKNSTSTGSSSSASKNDQLLKPLKINDEITIIPQPAKVSSSSSGFGGGKDSSTGSRNSTPGTSKNADSTSTVSNSSAENVSSAGAAKGAD